MGALTSLLVLSFLIFFHELGHFLAARFFGVHVEVFSIGFGTKIYSKKIGNTHYCLSLIPLGGYVQMKGQDDRDPSKLNYDNDSYTVKKPWQRIIILFAGPFANFLLAFLLYITMGTLGVTKLSPIIGKISDNSPAFQAGIESNDRILMINGVLINTWDEISQEIQKSGHSLILKLERKGEVKTISLAPHISQYQTIFGETLEKKMIGIGPSGKTIEVIYPPTQVLGFALEQTKNATTMILTGLQKLFQGIVSPKELGGIISIVQVTSEASDAGIIALFALTALISVNLGVLNLLPIPALDGGHILFNAYEIITRKAPNERVVTIMTMGGWAILLSLMLFTIINDIDRLVGG